MVEGNDYIMCKNITDILNTISELCLYIIKNNVVNKLILREIENAILYIDKLSKKEFKFSYKGYVLIERVKIILHSLNHDNSINIVGKITNLRLYIMQLVLDIMENKKIEIVFLPYKASMWDSFETVWEAAVNDIRCNPVVVPIPYYDRNDDFSESKWYYEGNDIPSNVPIVSYKEYDLKRHHPDVIFIHNPYDEYNKVTSVDSRFYSSNLKECTNMLVYIPYYVSGDYEEVENLFKFPGIVNADKIIVRNEKDRFQYLKIFPKDKISPLGSPKVEKALKMKPVDCKLPVEWKNKITGKKIILYNTHLSSILIDPKNTILKYNHVFDVVSQYDNAVLWWRPHPLMLSSIKSMCPEMLEAYLTTVKRFKKENIGIYDDTPDVHRAVYLSDVYYGDDISSLLYISQATGKLCVVQYYSKLICDNRYGGKVNFNVTDDNAIIHENEGEDKLVEILQNSLQNRQNKKILKCNVGQDILNMIISDYFKNKFE